MCFGNRETWACGHIYSKRCTGPNGCDTIGFNHRFRPEDCPSCRGDLRIEPDQMVPERVHWSTAIMNKEPLEQRSAALAAQKDFWKFQQARTAEEARVTTSETAIWTVAQAAQETVAERMAVMDMIQEQAAAAEQARESAQRRQSELAAAAEQARESAQLRQSELRAQRTRPTVGQDSEELQRTAFIPINSEPTKRKPGRPRVSLEHARQRKARTSLETYHRNKEHTREQRARSSSEYYYRNKAKKRDAGSGADDTEEAIADATEEPIADATEETIADATEETIADTTEEPFIDTAWL